MGGKLSFTKQSRPHWTDVARLRLLFLGSWTGSPAPTLCPPAGLSFLGMREVACARGRVASSGLEASVLASASCRPDFPRSGQQSARVVI